MPFTAVLEPDISCLVSLIFAYFVKRKTAGKPVKEPIVVILLSFLFIFFLLFPTQTLDASKSGLLLWFDTLLPTLLPFLIISQMILKTSLIRRIQKLLGPLFRRIFHCSEAGVFCLLCGFLCGYPVGARLIALQIQEEQLSREEGQYLLAFCNNISPMFCISYGILNAIGSASVAPYIFLIYGSALLFGLLTRPQKMPPKTKIVKKQTSSSENVFQMIDVCIIDSFLIMIRLCGYMILFSILCNAVRMCLSQKLIFAAPMLYSALEITMGLSNIAALPHGILRSALGTVALTFGGLCCIFQTNSVICNTGLSIKTYIFHKVLITLLALFLFYLWNFFFHSFFFTNGWG